MYTAGFSAELQTPNSGVVVRPIKLRPAPRIFLVRNVSAVARLPRMISEPISCRRPFMVGPRSFIRNGKPAKGPSRLVPSLAGSATASSNTSTTPDSAGSTLAMPAAACAANSAAVSSPLLTRAASATPSWSAHSSQLIGKFISIHPLGAALSQHMGCCRSFARAVKP